MTTPAIKICGLTEEDGVDAAVEAGVDMIGFVFFPPSPRAVTPERAAELLDAIPYPDEGGPLRVGLFVDPDDETVNAVMNAVRLDLIQLHGQETPERVEALRLEFGIEVMKALPVGSAEDLAAAQAYAGVADRLLLDAKPPAGADRPGGNAQAFDWSLLEGWEAPLPWVLAGGLTPETVAEAIKQTKAPAVDVSSGVESAPGIKDPEHIRRFVAAVRGT
ncbi:phosphoribosylanthranilate isomerase [Pararhodospirillum photometricum]|uniref:N-(5'-phosphoribosyl)anthranilate isomerase n=1 Tax=Pararhodospirillum photometricum DSM 122 TaxID=1150469 RepID=H6SN53_PARPM|nr:phosphoribosylanthranilate isomerase [Pararhodospirillum photometricum]CCG06929.1 N-(5'-phosphoribosyl)anthranilate isomerase [Pararhodospirillum photometricum DSM 122]